MRKIIINALIKEEIRIAILDGNRFQNIYFDVAAFQIKRQNIYKARVVHFESSLDALFVNFGGNRDGFLPVNNLCRGSLPDKFFDENGKLKENSRELADQELLVQIDREERENKGATLSTNLVLNGLYLLLVFGNDAKPIVSRSIAPAQRNELIEILNNLRVPDNTQVILRNVGRNCDAEQLQLDVDRVVEIHKNILQLAEEVQAPEFIYQDNNIISRALRDFCRNNVEVIVVDSEEYFNTCSKFLAACFPKQLDRLRLHDQPQPIFRHYDIEDQVRQLYKRKVRLASGGEIVIDYTEALTSIDINSARSTRKDNIEETALDTNLEAMDEIARQIRLRDIGGLIVIDVIDMKDGEAKQKIIDRLKNAVQGDFSFIRIGEISSFHLLEMTRERLMPSVRDTSLKRCHQCNGDGWTPSLTIAVAWLLRDLREFASRDHIHRMLVRAHYDLAGYVLNHHRAFLNRTEGLTDCGIVILPDANAEAYQYKLEELAAGPYHKAIQKLSMKKEAELIEPNEVKTSRLNREDFLQPAQASKPNRKLASKATAKSTGGKAGWLTRLFGGLFSGSSAKTPADDDRKRNDQQSHSSNQPRHRSRRRRGGRRGYNNNRRGGGQSSSS